jgi:predicted DNA-binding protein
MKDGQDARREIIESFEEAMEDRGMDGNVMERLQGEDSDLSEILEGDQIRQPSIRPGTGRPRR